MLEFMKRFFRKRRFPSTYQVFKTEDGRFEVKRFDDPTNPFRTLKTLTIEDTLEDVDAFIATHAAEKSKQHAEWVARGEEAKRRYKSSRIW